MGRQWHGGLFCWGRGNPFRDSLSRGLARLAFLCSRMTWGCSQSRPRSPWPRTKSPMRREREFFQVAETLSQPFELRVPCVQTSRGFSTILPTVRFLQSCVEEHGVRVPARALEISLDPLVSEMSRVTGRGLSCSGAPSTFVAELDMKLRFLLLLTSARSAPHCQVHGLLSALFLLRQ